jgi:hypothetical protein
MNYFQSGYDSILLASFNLANIIYKKVGGLKFVPPTFFFLRDILRYLRAINSIPAAAENIDIGIIVSD